jgi:hypothetical protein
VVSDFHRSKANKRDEEQAVNHMTEAPLKLDCNQEVQSRGSKLDFAAQAKLKHACFPKPSRPACSEFTTGSNLLTPSFKSSQFTGNPHY